MVKQPTVKSLLMPAVHENSERIEHNASFPAAVYSISFPCRRSRVTLFNDTRTSSIFRDCTSYLAWQVERGSIESEEALYQHQKTNFDSLRYIPSSGLDL